MFSAIAKCKSELNRKLFETISGQVGGGDLQPRGQGQRRLHLARRVLRTETRRTLKIQDSKNSSHSKTESKFPALDITHSQFLACHLQNKLCSNEAKTLTKA